MEALRPPRWEGNRCSPVFPERWPGFHPTDHPPAETAFKAHYHEVVRPGSQNRFRLKGHVRSLRRARPDVVLTQDEPWNDVTAVVELLCRAMRIPHVIFTWENLHRVPDSRSRRALERLALSLTSGVLAGSETAARRVRARGFGGPLAVAPQTGVDTELSAPGVGGSDALESFGVPPCLRPGGALRRSLRAA